MKTIRLIIIALVVVAVGFTVWMLLRPESSPAYKTQSARIKTITNMVELCTTELHEEIPVKDSINGKWIVARQTINGKIRFDIEHLRIENRGDTTFVYLPEERIDIYESAEPSAYQVLDTWDGKSTFFPRTLTAAEENTLKTRWQQRAEEQIRSRGYATRARRQAVETLTPLLNALSGSDSPVVLIDTKK